MKDYFGLKMGKHLSYRLFNAQKYAYICSPFIDQKYAKAIVGMAERGIPIKLICRDRQAGGFRLSDYFGSYYHKSKDDDFEVLMVEGEKFVHAKIFIVDDDYAVDGSANLTYPGLWNQVNIVHVYDTPEEVLRIKNTFEKIWDNNMENNEDELSKRNSYFYKKQHSYSYNYWESS